MVKFGFQSLPPIVLPTSTWYLNYRLSDKLMLGSYYATGSNYYWGIGANLTGMETFSSPLPTGTTSGVIRFDSRYNSEIRMRKPVMPLFKPPKFALRKRPVLVLPDEPVRRVGTSNRAYVSLHNKWEDSVRKAQNGFSNRLARYERRRHLIAAKQRSYLRTYNRRLATYHRKMSRYNHLVYMSKYPASKRLNGGIKYTKQNPHGFFQYTGTIIPVKVTREIISEGSGYFTTYYRTAPLDQDMDSSTFTGSSLYQVLSQLLTDDMISRMKAQALRKLSHQEFSLGLLLQERQESAQMIHDLLRLVKKSMYYWKHPVHLIVDGVKTTTTKSLADAWLRWHFGLGPLIKDARAIFKRLQEEPQNIGTVRIKCLIKRTVDQEVISLLGLPVKVSGEIRLTRTYVFEISNPLHRLLQEVGLFNIQDIVYQSTPWTFLLDWIYPLGDYLASKSATAGLTPLEATETLAFRGYVSGQTSLSDVFVAMIPEVADHPSSGTSTTVKRYFSVVNGAVKIKARIPITWDLRPDFPLQLKMPDCSLTRAITLAALLRQQLRTLPVLLSRGLKHLTRT